MEASKQAIKGLCTSIFAFSILYIIVEIISIGILAKQLAYVDLEDKRMALYIMSNFFISIACFALIAFALYRLYQKTKELMEQEEPLKIEDFIIANRNYFMINILIIGITIVGNMIRNLIF